MRSQEDGSVHVMALGRQRAAIDIPNQPSRMLVSKILHSHCYLLQQCNVDGAWYYRGFGHTPLPAYQPQLNRAMECWLCHHTISNLASGLFSTSTLIGWLLVGELTVCVVSTCLMLRVPLHLAAGTDTCKLSCLLPDWSERYYLG